MVINRMTKIARDECPFNRCLKQAQKGDAGAIEQIVESLRPYLTLIADQELDRRLQAKLGASDLVQSALFAANQQFGNFRGNSLEALRGWVRQILRNDLTDARRGFMYAACRNVGAEIRVDDLPVIADPLVDPWATPATMTSVQEQFDIVDAALHQLPENYRRAIQMRNWQDRTFREIGEELGTGEDAARKLWGRAILRLKEVIYTQHPGFESTS
jgi:RNA polymerase sigma-70 factor, ECF subfamily